MKRTLRLIALMLVVCMSMCILASCAPNADPDKALAALEKNGYIAAKDSTVVPIGLNMAFVIARVDATVKDCVVGSFDDEENDKVQSVTIVYFESKDDATAAFNAVKEYAEENKSEDEKTDFVFKQSGAMIYWGTSAGVKAAR